MTRRTKLWGAPAVVLLLAALLWLSLGREGKDADVRTTRPEVKRQAEPPLGRKAIAPPQWVVDRTARVKGRVIEETGRGIEGARVCAEVWSLQLELDRGEGPLCTFTDANGVYDLERLPALRVKVGVAAHGYLPRLLAESVNTWVLRASETREASDVVLTRGGEDVGGRVVDLFGGAIEGAFVIEGNRFARGNPAVSATTDHDGRFVLWGNRRSRSVFAGADGYAQREDLCAVRECVIVLAAEGRIAGVVVDTKGEGVAGAWVETVGIARPRGDHSRAGGRFELRGLSPGRYMVEARTESGVGRYGEVRVVAGETSDGIEVHLQPGVTISGTIVLADGSPCEACGLFLKHTRSSAGREVFADATGVVLIEGVAPGSYVGIIGSFEYPVLTIDPLVVPDEGLPHQRWQLSETWDVVGRVVDERGKAMAGAMVSARGQERIVHAEVGSDGSFTLQKLARGNYEFVARAVEPSQRTTSLQVEVPRAEEALLTLDAGRMLATRVVDAHGRPRSHVEVVVRGCARQRATTDAEGSLVLDGLIGERCTLAVSNYRLLDASGAPVDELEVFLGNTKSPVELKTADGRDRTLRGRVLDGRGSKRENVCVRAESQLSAKSQWSQQAVSDGQGQFAFPDAPGGDIVVSTCEAPRSRVSVTPDRDNADLVVPAGAELRGEVREHDGAIPAWVEVQLDEPPPTLFQYSRGAWSVVNLSPGPTSITISTPRGASSLTVDLQDGEVHDLGLLTMPIGTTPI